MKKILFFVMAAILALSLTGCQQQVELPPQASQMRAICELATMECYFHNVAKYKETNAEKFMMFSKDKHFWIEYAGQVTLGIDASLLDLQIDGETVTITMPPAKVLDCKVDEDTLNEDSFIVAKDSADITAADQTAAFKEAQQAIEEAASSDTALLFNAETRAKKLLEDYVKNIGRVTGIDYQVVFVDLPELADAPPKTPEASAAPAA